MARCSILAGDFQGVISGQRHDCHLEPDVNEKMWNFRTCFPEYMTEAGSRRRTIDRMRDHGTFSDGELLQQMRDGSEPAFTALYRRHHRQIYRFAYRMSGSNTIAEEVTQEVFLAVVRQPGRFAPEQGTLEAFLHGVARNHVLRSLERDRRFVGSDDEDADPASPARDVLDSLVNGQRLQHLRQAVLSLPETYREALVLCDLEELSYEDAAARIGCPVGTVRSRLSRARALLVGKLGAMNLRKSYSV